MRYVDWDMESAGRRNVRNALRRAKALFGDRNAYEWKDGETPCAVTFAGLCDDSEALAAELAARGCAGAHIAVCGANSYEWALSYMTAMSVGIAVPMSGDETAQGLEYLCGKGEVTVAFADAGAAERFPSGVEVIELRAGLRELVERGASRRSAAPEIDDDGVCEILFTSGTTGARRGVMLTHRNIMSIVCCDFPYLIGGRTLSVLPFSHGFEAVCHMLASLMPGVTMCLASSPRRFAADMAAFGVESVYVVPLQAQALLGPFAPLLGSAQNLKTLVCGGAPLSGELESAFAERGVRLLDGYGLSECSPLVTLNVNGMADSVGQAAEYCRVRIASPDAGGNGEIEVSGENVMRGYYNDPGDTAAAFTEDGWLRTGDIGRLDGEGNLFITGRSKNLIILSSGENVMPEELEAILQRHLPPEAEVRISEIDGALAVECWSGAEDAEGFAPVLRSAVEKLNSAVPPYKRVTEVRVLDAPLPKTALGKIVRH